MMPKVLIIIVTWNKKEYALRILDALRRISYPLSSVDILVVDNNSSDGTFEAIAASHPDVHLVRNSENIGGSGGFNSGLKWAFGRPEGEYQYFWLLDNDVVVHRDALFELITIIEKYPDIGIAGSTMMRLEKPWCIYEMGGFLNLRSGKLRFNFRGQVIENFKHKTLEHLIQSEMGDPNICGDIDKFITVDYVAAASLLVRASVARQAGLFRDYFIHFDDVEWCLRISTLGFRTVVCEKSLIWHASSSSSHKKIPESIYYYNNRNLLDLLDNYGGDAHASRRYRWRVWIKALIFAVGGKIRISYLHLKALSDFNNAVLGPLDERVPTWKVFGGLLKL